MKPVVRRLAWLAGIAGAGALVVALGDWRRDDTVAPQQASPPAPAPSLLAAGGGQVDPARAAEAAPAPAVAALPASGVLRRPPADASRMQRDIQLAVSSNQRGKAGEAARHIQSCLALERDPERRRKSMEDNLRRFPEPVASAMRASHQELVASCQAVDAAARAQLVPLLRRSLAEGDKGAAAGLVMAIGRGLNPADELDVVPALRRDAWDCDRVSLSVLNNLVNRHPQLLPPNEVGAVREQQRSMLGSALESMRRQAESDPKRLAAMDGMLATFKPPPEANPAEVARISADIRSRCDAARAARPGGGSAGVPS